MKYIPEIEFATTAEIFRYQSDKLRTLVKYVAERSPYYKALFSEHQIQPDAIVSLDDLVRLPTTSKDSLQQSNWDFLCVGRNEIVEYTSTSGTLGKPVTIGLSVSDLGRLAYNEAISFACADGSAHDLYQLMLTLDKQFMAGIAYYEGIRKLGAGIIRVGPGLPAMQWDSILRLQPTALVAVPSFVVRLLDYAKEHKIDVNKTAVRKITCIGENIRNADLLPNTLAEKITRDWDVTLYGTYASTEMQTAFSECSYGMGGHHHPELLIVEILGDDDRPVKPGEAGELTITTLGVEAMPLIRYKTGDITRAYTEACKCGRTTLRLGPVLGRRQQMLKLKGTTVYPLAVFEILNAQSGVLDYVVEAVTGDLGTDELKIYILVDPEQRITVQTQLQARFQSVLRVIPEVVFTDHHALERLNGSGQLRKVRKFVDSRS